MSLQPSLPQARPLQKYLERPAEIDRHLPVWARRSHPIIRRHLGMQWKTILPETRFLVRAFLFQAFLIILSAGLPFIFDFILPAITAAVLLLPIAWGLYIRTLIRISLDAAQTLSAEIQSGTFILLRVTPYHLRNLLASHAAAFVWRQVESLSLLIVATTLLSLPIVAALYSRWWPLDEYPWVGRLAFILGIAVSMLRVLLEPILVAVVGMACSAALKTRSTAVFMTLFLGGFYFLVLNLARLLPVAWPLRFIIEFVLPLALPAAIIALCFRLLSRWLVD